MLGADDSVNEINPPAIVGENVAGRSATVRKEIKKLIKASASSEFDLADLLWESKSKNYYRDWGFETFGKYIESLAVEDLGKARGYYLARIVDVMKISDVPRATYEPVGITKLRIITRLEPTDDYDGIKGSVAIKELVSKAGQLTSEELAEEVNKLKGEVGDESMVWMNIHIKKLARENIILPAIALAKKHIGTVKTDAEGQAVDASDGAALEVICANFLADPNFAEEALTPELDAVLEEVAAEEPYNDADMEDDFNKPDEKD